MLQAQVPAVNRAQRNGQMVSTRLPEARPRRMLPAMLLRERCGHPDPSGRGGPRSAPVHSCATFALAHGSTLVVGHNLDEYIELPGLIVVNSRGLAKRNITFRDLVWPFRLRPPPRLDWVSRYGSVTYNTFGREFPDGGMNEAGLYVGEMTLLSTVWPRDPRLPRMYHHQWMQYLLDNFATVEEALGSLSTALPEGHCRWHFFLADKGGDAAVVEFLEQGPVVHTGPTLPYKILCNARYDAELQDLRNYIGFGGTKAPEPRYEKEDPRFRWAATMLRDYTGAVAPAEYALAILDRMDLGNRKWVIVCDIPNARMYVRTSLAPKLRWVEFAPLDFGCSRFPQALDIQRDMEGDVTDQFSALTADWNRDAIGQAWAEIDTGFLGNLLVKPRMVSALAKAPAGFSCAKA